MLIHGVEAGQHLEEAFGADGDHRRQADRRVHRIAAADPVPELEHVARVDAELAHLRLVGGHRHEVLFDCRVAAERVDEPGTSGAGVGHRLERGERLGRHDEQRLGRVQVASGLHEIRGIHVRHEAEGHFARGIGAQRLVRHHRAEVRAADADVDHSADALAREPDPGARSDALGEDCHALEHRLDVRHDVVAVDHDRLVRGCAQRDVQDGAVFGHVDPLAAEHGVDTLAKS